MKVDPKQEENTPLTVQNEESSQETSDFKPKNRKLTV